MAGYANYEKFIYEINSLLKQSQLYPKYSGSIAAGKNDYKLSQAFTKKNYSTEWIAVLEDCITALDTVVRNPRKFIVIEEDIVDISLARSISVDSVKHLAQHTNLISSVTKDGLVIPSKILNTSKEESYEIYENRFIYTLLLKTSDFLNIRFEAIKGAMLESGELGVTIKSDYRLDGQKVTYDLETHANFPFEAVVKGKTAGLSDVERLTRIKSIFGDFLSSVFAKEMSICALVRPPIQRTNVILKDPNFKKALVLWQYIESCEKMDFKVETETEVMELPPSLSERYRSFIFLNTVLLQSIAASRDVNETFAEAGKKQKELADEYISKNIDDFVPDDFPFLKMELSEIRRIYYRIPGAKTLHLTEVSKMNAALDRVLRQFKINKTKEESDQRKRLIAEQLKEEEQAKRLALREAKEAEHREKQQEIFEKREAARLLKERLAAEKIAEEERLAREKAEEEKRLAREKAEEEKRLAREKAEEEERLAREKECIEREKTLEEEKKRLEEQAKLAETEKYRLAKEAEEQRLREEKEAEEIRFKLEEEAKEIVRREEEVAKGEEENLLKREEIRIKEEENERLKQELLARKLEQEERIKTYAAEMLRKLRLDAEKKRMYERELALRLLTERVSEPLEIQQEETLRQLKNEEAVGLFEVKRLTEEASVAISDHFQTVLEELKKEARTFHSLENVIHIARALNVNQPAERKYKISDKLRAASAVRKYEDARKKAEKKRRK